MTDRPREEEPEEVPLADERMFAEGSERAARPASTPGAIPPQVRRTADPCPACGHDRRGLPLGTACPECGARPANDVGRRGPKRSFIRLDQEAPQVARSVLRWITAVFLFAAGAAFVGALSRVLTPVLAPIVMAFGFAGAGIALGSRRLTPPSDVGQPWTKAITRTCAIAGPLYGVLGVVILLPFGQSAFSCLEVLAAIAFALAARERFAALEAWAELEEGDGRMGCSAMAVELPLFALCLAADMWWFLIAAAGGRPFPILPVGIAVWLALRSFRVVQVTAAGFRSRREHAAREADLVGKGRRFETVERRPSAAEPGVSCPHCGFDLRGRPRDAVCPECGTRR